MQLRTILTAVLLAVASLATAQIEQFYQEPQREIFDVVEQMPSFPGGNQALMTYLDENKEYPIVAWENGVQGRVVVSFVVEADGSIDDVKVARSVDPSLDREAARVVSMMPKWIPGTKKRQACCCEVQCAGVVPYGCIYGFDSRCQGEKEEKEICDRFLYSGLDQVRAESAYNSRRQTG